MADVDPERAPVRRGKTARVQRAEQMLAILRDDPIPDHLRSKFWRLSVVVGGRSAEEREIIDALCCLLHKAIDQRLDPASLIKASCMHVQKETGIEILPRVEVSDAGASIAGDRLVIHCLDTGRLWSDVHGWVSDPLEATTYDEQQAADIELPGGNCSVAEIAHVRDLFQIDHWPVTDGVDCGTPTPKRSGPATQP